MGIPPLLATAFALLLVAPDARSETACFKDAERVCPDVKPGDPGFVECLRARRADLSKSCQHDLDRVDRLEGEFQTSCRLGVLQWCHDVPKGGGRVLACLDKHAVELSPDCAQAVAIALDKSDVIADACAEDLKKHCPGVPPGEGRRYICLSSKAQLLSPRCRDALRP
jgi:hypothetical protein